jgi:deazaflavin-dependent oxidoreductase (nitroreductase family)
VEEVIDSPVGWVAKQMKAYVEAGRTTYYGRETLLLTTRGRRSGKLRRTALFYGTHGSAYVVVGSNGGSKEDPLWCRNVAADPNVTVQVGEDIFPARARLASGAERSALWELMNGIFPTYASYEKKSRRQLPVIVLERAA